MIDFSPLWVTMKKKNITQYQLIKIGTFIKLWTAREKIKNIPLAKWEIFGGTLNLIPNDVVGFTNNHAKATNPKIPQNLTFNTFYRTNQTT